MGFDNNCILFLYSIAAEYFCTVCRTLVYPHEALQTPCTHLYCKQCLVHIACSTQACPFDGHLVTEADSKPLVETDKALAENIGKVLVRCNYHMSGCMWQGPLSECIVHRSQCAFGDFQVFCIVCGIQMMHREAEAHAQICNINAYPQMFNSQAVESHGQPPLMVHSSSGQVLAQLTQPPFPLRPLEPPQRLPPHIQPGLPVVEVQQPMGQQLPQVSTGYASGHVHGQLHLAGGPPQLMQQPPLAHAQQQLSVTLAHGMQSHFSQSYMGRTATLNQAGSLSQSSVIARSAPYAWPPEFGSSQSHLNQIDVNLVNHFTEPQSMKTSDMDANGPGANLNKLKPEAEANNQYRPENAPLNWSGLIHPPRPYDPSSFTFFPQYQVGGSSAPSSPAVWARGPTNFANHGKNFESQYPGVQGQYCQSHSPQYRPPGFVSSPPVPFHEQVRHLGEGFPYQHHSPGTELTRPRLSEPGFRTSYPHHEFPSGGPFCAGGSDSVDNLRKRKTVSIGWCHLCQVDCESVEGLEMHRETHDYQRMYMDVVNNIRLKSARIAKEASEPGSAGSPGCGSKP